MVGGIIGSGIDLVSSLLGVAGGELLIPALIFVFGVDIRTAGSASILVLLCLMGVGFWRYWHIGAFPRGRGIQRITSAMSLGSFLGAGLGGLALAVVPVAPLKLLLGGILIAASGKRYLLRLRHRLPDPLPKFTLNFLVRRCMLLPRRIA